MPIVTDETKKTPDYSKPCKAHEQMQKYWALPDALLTGTIGMREAGTKYLPQEPLEDPEAYNVRLSRSVLYEGYAEGLKKISGRPFIRPVDAVAEETLPEKLKLTYEAPCKDERDITAFAKSLHYWGWHHGMVHVLVDYPNTEQELSYDQEINEQIRPYFTIIRAPNLIGWRGERLPSGEMRLTQIRYKYEKTITVDDVNEEQWEYVRMITAAPLDDPEAKGTTQIFKRLIKEGGVKDDKWIAEPAEDFDQREIPLRTFYVRWESWMESRPALEGLSWLNLLHWQSSSDQRNILRFLRFAILFAPGWQEEDTKRIRAVGASRLAWIPDKDADLRYVEHSGKGVEAGRVDIEALEYRMDLATLEPFVKRPAQETATSKRIDETKSQSQVQIVIRDLEAFLLELFWLAASWIDKELNKDFGFKIFSDFNVAVKATEDLEYLLKMRMNEYLGEEDYLREVKRRNILDEAVPVEDLIERLHNEGVNLVDKDSMPPRDDDEKEEPEEPEE